MMRFFKSVVITTAFGLSATVMSCNKTCDTGYEGKRCDVEIRGKFIGVWNATDNPGNITYLDTITEGQGILDVTLLGFQRDTFHRFIRATIDGNTISIASHRPNLAKSVKVEGVGTINSDNNSISWNYSLIDTTQTPTLITNYTGVWTK